METPDRLLNAVQILMHNQWAWIINIFLVVLGVSTINLIQRRIIQKLLEAAATTSSPWDDSLLKALRKPLSLLVWVLGISFAIDIIGDEIKSPILVTADTVRDVAIVGLIAFFLSRFIRYAEHNISTHKREQGKPFDPTTLDAVAKLIRLSVYITSVLVVMQTLGFSVSGVLAFGGIGGMAVGFAAKDLLANFFGGLMIYLDRPFKVGDWIRSPDKEIEGIVESVEWRRSIIRTFDKRELHLPNSIFSTISVENASRMTHRRIFEKVGIRYEDKARMHTIIDDIKQMLRNHAEIDPTQTLIVNFNEFAPSSLDFFIYCFTKTVDWTHYHTVKQDVLLKVMDIIQNHGADVAYPTSTLHVNSHEPPTYLMQKAS